MQIISVTTAAAAIAILGSQTTFAQAHPALRGTSAATWTQIVTAKSPPKRAAAAMAYDPVSRKVVLFGGFSRTGYLGDTWTFDGTSWSRQHPSTSPSVRAASSMAYDRKAKALVLFGGYDGVNFLGDTWLWDGSTSQWIVQQPKRSPVGLTGPAVFTDPLDGKADIFGGFDGFLYHADTWRWTGTTWHRLHTPLAPYGRSGMVYGTNPVTRSSVVFGGLADANSDNTWVWDGRQWTQASPSMQPPSVYYSAAAYDSALNAIVTFGGGSGGVDLSDTWAWSSSAWMQILPTTSPSPRESHSMAYDAALGRIVLFGGTLYSKGVLFNDTWEFSP